MVKVSCQNCGKEFEAKRRDAKYCSDCNPIKHREYGRKTDAERHFVGNCIDCGKPVTRSSVRGGGRCLSCSKKGKLNKSWKGGRHKSIAGYIYILKPDHPRANKFHDRYVAEHQLVWEKAHNQLLPEGYLIHHLNGIKDDNRPENLVALQPKRHSTRTRLDIAEQRIRELEQQLRDN